MTSGPLQEEREGHDITSRPLHISERSGGELHSSGLSPTWCFGEPSVWQEAVTHGQERRPEEEWSKEGNKIKERGKVTAGVTQRGLATVLEKKRRAKEEGNDKGWLA